MNKNWLVLLGSAVLMLGAICFPIITYTQATPSGGTELVRLPERSSIFLGLLVLLFMFSKRHSRGLAWAVLGIAGISWVLSFTNALFSSAVLLHTWMESTRGIPVHAPGFYLIIGGFVLVIVGGVWEYAHSDHKLLTEHLPKLAVHKPGHVLQ